ncbi:MAG: response regulator [Chitinispirillaceae bacterium]
MQFEIEKKRSRINILVIEDENLLREYMCDFLEDIGFSTLQAENGKVGLDFIRNRNPDLVLTDLRMPELNGLDVLSAIQKDYPDLPVVVISGTGSLSDVVQTLKLGAWDYILKPIHDYNVLEMAVTRVLERKQLIDENRRYKEHLEEEVEKRSNELLKSTKRFKTLFNSVVDAVFIHDLDGKIIDFNEQAVRHTGYQRERLLEMTMQQLFTESAVGVFLQSIAQLPEKHDIIYESEQIRNDNSLVPVELHACMITMDSSPQVLVVCRDISERRRTEKERKELEKQIVSAQKMELVGVLAGGIAHDFNNVLTALTGYVYLLQESVVDNEKASDYLDKVNEIAIMGQSLTRRLTSFIRKEREELGVVDIHKVLNDTVALLRPSCKGISIELEPSSEKHIVLGDETQLQNAFLNMGINARDSITTYEGRLAFRTSLVTEYNNKQAKDYICVEVADNGTGMDSDTQAKIFEPFFTTKEKGKGTGLGLTSVLYCVKNLQGKIDVRSEPGKGTTFRVTLPIYRESEASGMKKGNPESQVIIIAQNTTAELIQEMMGKEGIHAKLFRDFSAFLDYLKSCRDTTAIVFFDFYYPLVSESEAVEKITAVSEKIPVITISCKDMVSLRSSRTSYQYNGLVDTPMDSERFYESIRLYIKENVINNADKDWSVA